MATIADVMHAMQVIAPEQFAEEFDNVGLTVGRRLARVSRVLCCLDVTDAVLSEAIDGGCEMIVSHHPMIFSPIKKINDGDVLGAKILRAVENGIAIYAAHTNLDWVADGLNEYLAGLMGLNNVDVLDPYISPSEGVGRVGELPAPVYCTVLKGELSELLDDSYVRIIGEPFAQVRRVAVINGGGGGDTAYVDLALRTQADCLVTADVKHHVAVYAKENGITVIEPQHYTMEHCYMQRMAELLSAELRKINSGIEVIHAERDINPRF